jgi:hypothetical protein
MSLAKDLFHWVSFVEGDSSEKVFPQGEALQTCGIFYKSLKLFSRLYARVIARNIFDQAQQKFGRNDFLRREVEKQEHPSPGSRVSDLAYACFSFLL